MPGLIHGLDCLLPLHCILCPSFLSHVLLLCSIGATLFGGLGSPRGLRGG